MNTSQETTPSATTSAGLPDTISDSREYFNEFLPRLVQEKQDISIGNTNFTCMFHIGGEKGGNWLFTIENGKIKPPIPCDETQTPCIIAMDNATLPARCNPLMRSSEDMSKLRVGCKCS